MIASLYSIIVDGKDLGYIQSHFGSIVESLHVLTSYVIQFCNLPLEQKTTKDSEF